MELTSRLPGRRSRTARLRRQGARVAARAARSRTHAAASTVGAIGAGAALATFLRKRRAEGPRVHTTPQEGHPAGTGERSERDIGGPTSPEGGDG